MRIRTTAVVTVLVGTACVSADVYDFGLNGDNKNNITWESRATIETMIGTTVKCDGIAVWDADDLTAGSLAFSVPVDSIKSGIDHRDRYMRSAQWLDAENHPTITFKTTRVEAVAGKKDTYLLIGEFTCKGAAKTMSITATISAVPAKKELEDHGYVGGILHINAAFKVKLADHNIALSKKVIGVKIAEAVTITVDLFGFTNNKPTRSVEEVKKAFAAVK